MARIETGLLWAAWGVIGVAVVCVVSVFRSSSSTAAFGILAIPCYAVPFALLFFVVGYCVSDLVDWLKRKTTEHYVSRAVRAGVAFILLSCGLSYLTYGLVFTMMVIRAQTISEPALHEFLERSRLRNNKYALGAVAQNPNASAEILHRVALMPDPDLHHRMWSAWPVMGDNGKGLAVMRLIVMHKNVSEETLVTLSKSPSEYVRADVAGNPKTPLPVIRELSKDWDYLMQWSLANNPKAPADLLDKIVETGDEIARANVASNSGAPVEILERLADDPSWLVRRDLAYNSSTPAEIIERLANDPDERVRSTVEYLRRQSKD